MNQNTPIKEFFVVGGTMSPDAPSYVVRQADTELYNHCIAGNFCYVLTPRQMGKSSLMARTAYRLNQQGVGTAQIDLNLIGTEKEAHSAGQWYYGIAHRMVRELCIDIELSNWWRAREELPAMQRLTEFFEDVVLKRIAGPVVIFLDEIDATINLPFTDDFFAAIRACYNARATQLVFGRLSFVLLGVATPSQLIKDTQCTPFNIGYPIELTDFTLAEARPLAQFPGLDETGALKVLERILYWSGGHPYLTQKLCRIVAAGNRERCSDVVIDGIVAEHFLTADARRSDSNLSFVRDRLLVNKKKEVKRLKLYRRIVKGDVVGDEPLSLAHATLKLSGVAVVRDNQQLQVRNRIYEQIFSVAWVKDEMPINWNRNIAVAAIGLLFLSFIGWYLLIFPQQYINAILRADLDVPNVPYEKLRRIPGYVDKADTLFADYWDRRALRAELEENRDQALLYRLKALKIRDTETRRRKVSLLVGDDYRNIKRTYRLNGPVIVVAFSPDGKTILTGSFDGYARLWNATTGQAEGVGMKHKGPVNAVAFSPDGKTLLTGSNDGYARLWNVATCKAIGVGMKHKGSVNAVAFNPDGKTLLTGGKDGYARLWNASTNQAIGHGMKHRGVVTAVTFSPNGKTLLTGSVEGTKPLWYEPMGVGEKDENTISISAIIKNYKTLLSDSYFYYTWLWTAAASQSMGVGMKHKRAVIGVGLSPDGETELTTCSSDILFDGTGYAMLWNASTGQAKGLGMEHESGVTAVAFSPDGKNLLSFSSSGYARLWNAATCKAMGVGMGQWGWGTTVAFSPDGKTITVVTDQWIHQGTLSGETITNHRSRLLPYPSFFHADIYFPDNTADRIQVAVRVTGDSIKIITLQMDKPDAPPIQGDPAELLQKWQEKLGLKLKEDGKIEPLYPFPRQ